MVGRYLACSLDETMCAALCCVTCMSRRAVGASVEKEVMSVQCFGSVFGGRWSMALRYGVIGILGLLIFTGMIAEICDAAPTTAKKASVDLLTGKARWYGEFFHGRPTASGESFDMYALTAAHRTLPLGTLARIVNLDNGKTVVVRINDRGPFDDVHVIEVSRKAAQQLGMLEKGTAQVRIEPQGQADGVGGPEKFGKQDQKQVAPVGPHPAKKGADDVSARAAAVARQLEASTQAPSAPDAASPALPSASKGAPHTTDPDDVQGYVASVAPGIYIQIGAFKDSDNAQQYGKTVSKVRKDIMVWRKEGQTGTLWFVLVGPLLDRSEADDVQALLQAKGHTGFITVLR